MDTIDSLLRDARRTLERAGVETPALDARLLVRHALGLDDVALIARGVDPVPAGAGDAVAALLARRAEGEPVSRIMGVREFYGRTFAITPDTLDPRPDTEILIDQALGWARTQKKDLRILDLGTGSGCILITLLAELPGATGIGVDLNPGAVDVSRENAVKHGVESRTRVFQGDWFTPLPDGERFDLIVSNPPYIPEKDIESLAREVRNHDPILALVGGNDGLDPYKIIFSGLEKHLFPGGRAFLEFGFGQAESLSRLVDDSGLFLSRITPDLAGIPRVVEITNGEN